MNDMNVLQDRITGLKAKALSVQRNINLYNEAKGLEKEKQRAMVERDELTKEHKDLKEKISDLQTKKNAAIANTGNQLAEVMSKILPIGKAFFEITPEGDALLGYVNAKKHPAPYHALSGGEKAMFDAALCKAMKGTVVLSEMAELGSGNLINTLNKAKEDEGVQYIFATCHQPKLPVDGWKVVVVE